MKTNFENRWHKLRSVLSGYKWRVISYVYIGTRFHCPICRGRFRKLRPQYEKFSILGTVVWDGFRDNNVCPRCNSLMRHRFLVAFLRAKTDLFTDRLTVLHFAPEEASINLFKKSRNLRYMPVDVNPWRGDIGRMDITAIPRQSSSIDVVLCSHVLEHVEDDQAAMSEVYRVLKPGGWAVVAVPIFVTSTYDDATVRTEEERLRMFGSAVHVRLYGPDIVDRLQKAGFAVETYSLDDIPGTYFDRSVQTPALDAERYLFFCRKEAMLGQDFIR